MNIVLDEAFEEKPGGEKVAIGMIVCVVPILARLQKWMLIDYAGHSR